MALYPIKVLLDKDRNVFIPFLPADAIPINGSDETVTQALANRYTKAEVDAIIQGLGTLQVLRGRVATRADLDDIQNPQAGDTYIVGTSTTNNSEWMWIGNAWEELGPMMELSGYYTKTETDTLLTNYATIQSVTQGLASKVDASRITSGQSTTVGDVYDVTYINGVVGAKVNTSDIINDVAHTDTNKPLSANMGKELNARIQNLASIGKYLAMWDCTTGLPTTNPVTIPYAYTTGDYYVISKKDGQRDARVPDDFVEVEYIESTGTQYIDTGVFPTQNTRFGVEVSKQTLNNTEEVFIGSNYNDRDTNHININSSNKFVRWFSNGLRASSESMQPNQRYLLNNYSSDPLKLYNYDTQLTDSFYWSLAYGPTQTLSLFCGRLNNIPKALASMRLYSCEIYSSIKSAANKSREFVPCYRKSDNKPGLYDLVNDVFYTNDGTGEFLVGPAANIVNYIPNGNNYTGTASTTEYTGTEELAIGDFFYYDGTSWSLMKNTGRTASFASLAGQPTDNINLAATLNNYATKTYVDNAIGNAIEGEY